LVESLPFCAEKRSALLSEIEDPLLLSSKSIRSSSRKHGDYRGVTQQFCVATLALVGLSLVLLILVLVHFTFFGTLLVRFYRREK
jgi:hypothetical protein